jgi:signal transduction histidine kinase
VHDVLAHSLGALAVQLEALDALLDSGDMERARNAVATSRRLAVEGLDETRRAVHALRDAPLALAERVAMLAAQESARFVLEGSEHSLPSDGALALYRAAQEALTNARKHAPGAVVSVVLRFSAEHTSLTIVDEYPAGTPDCSGTSTGSGRSGGLHASAVDGSAGPGYGLTGMRERLELLGGTMTAGPYGETGWQVAVELPNGPTRAGTGSLTSAAPA